MARTYLLNAAQNVKRVHWYMWDRPEIGSTKMVAADRTTPTLAGRAFGLVQGWMLGGKLVGPTRSSLPCAKDKAGTYTCVIKYRGGVKRVYWNPNKRVKIRTAKSATFAVNTTGVFNISRAVTRRMVPRRSGTVVTVGSNAATTPRMAQIYGAGGRSRPEVTASRARRREWQRSTAVTGRSARAAPGCSTRYSSTPRGWRGSTCAAGRLPAAASAGRTGATISGPRSSA